jgi:hypothetical protein
MRVSSGLRMTPGEKGARLGCSDFLMYSVYSLDVMVKHPDRPVALFNLHAKERLHEASSSDVEIPRVLLHELVLELLLMAMCIMSSTNSPGIMKCLPSRCMK